MGIFTIILIYYLIHYMIFGDEEENIPYC